MATSQSLSEALGAWFESHGLSAHALRWIAMGVAFVLVLARLVSRIRDFGPALLPRQRIARMLLYVGGGIVVFGLALMPMHLTLGWPSWTVSLAGFLAIAGFVTAAIGSFFSGYLGGAPPTKSGPGEEKP